MAKALIINDSYDDNNDSDVEFVPFPQSFAYCVSNLITNNKKNNSKKSRDVKSAYVTLGGYKVSVNK